MESALAGIGFVVLFLGIIFVAVVLSPRPSEEKATPLELQKGDHIVLKGTVRKVERCADDLEAVEVLSVSEGSSRKPHVRLVLVKYPQSYEMTHEIDLMQRDVLRWNYYG